MRIYSKMVWQWVGERLVRVEEEWFEYTGPIALAKGGSSGPYYDNLNRLYGTQAQSAEYLNKIFQGDIGPAYQRYLAGAEGAGSQAKQEEAAGRAAATGQEALTGQEEALSSNLMSMGIDPSDARYQTMLAKQRTAGAGMMAGQETAARQAVRDTGDARFKGAISLGMGVPDAASSAANTAGNIGISAQNAWQTQQAQQANAVGNIARLGTNYAGDYNKGGFADGGPVGRQGLLRLENGGYVHRLAKGGFLTQPVVPSPPPMGPPKQQANPAGAAASGVTAGGGTAATAGGLTRGAGYGIQQAGSATGSLPTEAYGTGLRMGASGPEGRVAAQATQDWMKQEAAKEVDAAMGKTVESYNAATQASQPAAVMSTEPAAVMSTEPLMSVAPEAVGALGEAGSAGAAGAAGAVEAGAEAATVGAGAGLAEGASALGAGAGLAAGIGTAVPVIGAGLAAYAIGNQMGWWADGGPVNRYANAGRNAAFTDQDEPPPPQQGIGNPVGRYVESGRIGPYDNGASGGEVDGPGGPKDDKIHAMLSDGEYVMPRGAVLMFGLKHLDSMRQKGLDYEKQMGIH